MCISFRGQYLAGRVGVGQEPVNVVARLLPGDIPEIFEKFTAHDCHDLLLSFEDGHVPAVSQEQDEQAQARKYGQQHNVNEKDGVVHKRHTLCSHLNGNRYPQNNYQADTDYRWANVSVLAEQRHYYDGQDGDPKFGRALIVVDPEVFLRGLFADQNQARHGQHPVAEYGETGAHDEENEIAPVPEADAVPHKETMVVKAQHALVAVAAVR